MAATPFLIAFAMKSGPAVNVAEISIRDAAGSYFLLWGLCAIGLGLVAWLCRWQRSEGNRSWRYTHSMGVTYLAMMMIAVVPAFLLFLSGLFSSQRFPDVVMMALMSWVLGCVFPLYFTWVNQFLIVPAIIEAWYATLNRGTSHEALPAATRRRRVGLYGLSFMTVIVLISIGFTKG